MIHASFLWLERIILHRTAKSKFFFRFAACRVKLETFYRLVQPFVRRSWHIEKFFVKSDEISLENTGFPLAFCAIFLYNEHNVIFGGVCRWVS